MTLIVSICPLLSCLGLPNLGSPSVAPYKGDHLREVGGDKSPTEARSDFVHLCKAKEGVETS